MATPKISLRNCDEEGSSVLVPGVKVQTYKNPLFSDVHFHEDRVCEDRLSSYLWGLGSYLGPETLKDGKRTVYAHFTSKNGEQIGRAAPSENAILGDGGQSQPESLTRDRQPLPHIKKEEDKEPILISSDGEEENEDEPLMNVVARNRERAGAEVLQVSESRVVQSNNRNDGDVVPHAPPARLPEIPEINHFTHPPLPAGLSQETWKRDIRSASKNNANPDHPYYNANWNNIGPDRRRRLANARLMHGAYGIDNPEPCFGCKSAGVTCRIWHPSIRTRKSEIVHLTCARCRPTNTRCVRG